MEQNCCLYCKHFKIWYDDPCCLEKDEWKIILPSMSCEKFDMETFKPAIQMHIEMWKEHKEQFFKTYPIDKEELIKKHLELFPEDKDLIETNGRE